MRRLFRLATAVAVRMPRGLLDALLGTLLAGFFLHPLRRRIVLANYRRILAWSGHPADPARLRALIAQTRPLYTRMIAGMLGRPEDVAFARDNMDLAAVLAGIEEARARGRGVILALSNFGLFSHTMMALALRGIPLKIPILDRRTVAHLPHGWPELFVTVGRSSRECLDALSRNEVAVIMTMVNYMPRRLTLDLFGAPARLGYAPAKLSAASGAPILPAFTVYEDGRCRVLTDGLLPPAEGPGGVEEATARLARVQEKYIALHPAQWHVYEDFWDLRWMDANFKFVGWMLRGMGA